MHEVGNNLRHRKASIVIAISMAAMLLSAMVVSFATAGLVFPSAEAAKPQGTGGGSGKPPQVRINSPVNGEILDAGSISITGTSSDSSTLNVVVSVRIDSGSYETATPKSTDDFSSWSAMVDISNSGTHTIEARAQDSGNGKTATRIITITVTSSPIPPPPPDPPADDTTPPSITAPPDLTREASGPQTSVSLGTPIVSDNVDPSPTVSNDAPPGFALGATMVEWTATDDSLNSASDIQAVTVRDTTAPTIVAPADITRESTNGSPVTISSLGSPTVNDIVDTSPTVSNDATSNSYPVGETLIVWRAADDSGNSAQDTQKVIVTSPSPPPDSPKTGVYVPLYMYPGGTGWTHWQTVIDAKNAHPSVPFVASINPSSGVGSSKNSAFVTGIGKLKAAGITVIGYVYTDYGARDINVVKSEISKYKEWYNVDGIMFDEMSNKVGFESYYRSLTDYAKSIGMTYTKGNPGADVPASFVGTVDNLSIRETSGYPSTSQLGGWHTNYDKKNWSFVSYGVSNLDTALVSNLSQYVGLMYITNDVLSNPYDTVPSYFATLVATLDTGTSSTSSSSSSTSSSTTTTSATSSAQELHLTIKSADLSNNQITGMYTTIESSTGFPLLSSFTTVIFNGASGSTYTITVANYGDRSFDHWENGSTSRTRTLTLNQDTTITAFYKIGP